MKKTKRRGKKKNTRPKFFLDTSIQVEKIKRGNPNNFLSNLGLGDGKFCTSYFVLYEYKSGFLGSLIRYYFLVKICGNPADAKSFWSDGMQPREQKYAHLLDSVLYRINESIDVSNYDNHLRQLEIAIKTIYNAFYLKIEKRLVSDSFQNDSIVKYELNSKSDFEGFKDLLFSRKTIDQISFWKNNKENLSILVDDKNIEFKKEYSLMHKRLCGIEKDFRNSEKVRTNNGVGDAIISMISPKKCTLVTLDKSYDLLCPLLSKQYTRVPKEKSPKIPFTKIENA